MINTRDQNLLEIKALSVYFLNGRHRVEAVRNVSLEVGKGEIVGLVGESGSGKSVTARAVAGLINYSKTARIEGSIRFNGQNLLNHQTRDRHRNRKISMIFQDPNDSLNPSLTVGYQIDEVFIAKKEMSRKLARKNTLALLHKVRIASPCAVAGQYPHQLSGGMCQRIMIAIALAADPDLLIADEPTTALDVTIQARILKLLHAFYRTTGKSILFITHNLGVIAQFCHSVAVMLEGEIVEKGSVKDIFTNPLHPYTQGLLGSIPMMGKKKRLTPMAPAMKISGPFDGCRYYYRCSRKNARCRSHPPLFSEHKPGHYVRCMQTTERRIP